MVCVNPLPLVLGLAIAVLLGFITIGFIRTLSERSMLGLVAARDNLLVGLLVLAAFASGAFSMVILFTFAK